MTGRILPRIPLCQVLRYMGFVREQVAEDDQVVEGAIIALEDDQKMRWALLSVPSISLLSVRDQFPPGEKLIESRRRRETRHLARA